MVTERLRAARAICNHENIVVSEKLSIEDVKSALRSANVQAVDSLPRLIALAFHHRPERRDHAPIAVRISKMVLAAKPEDIGEARKLAEQILCVLCEVYANFALIEAYRDARSNVVQSVDSRLQSASRQRVVDAPERAVITGLAPKSNRPVLSRRSVRVLDFDILLRGRDKLCASYCRELSDALAGWDAEEAPTRRVREILRAILGAHTEFTNEELRCIASESVRRTKAFSRGWLVWVDQLEECIKETDICWRRIDDPIKLGELRLHEPDAERNVWIRCKSYTRELPLAESVAHMLTRVSEFWRRGREEVARRSLRNAARGPGRLPDREGFGRDGRSLTAYGWHADLEDCQRHQALTFALMDLGEDDVSKMLNACRVLSWYPDYLNVIENDIAFARRWRVTRPSGDDWPIEI